MSNQSIESALEFAHGALPESYVAILAAEVKRLREYPDEEMMQKALNAAYRRGNNDAHVARDICGVILPVAQPEVQRGGAVVVPEPTSDEWKMIAQKAGIADMVDFLSGAAAYGLWLRGKVQPIPDERVLKDGQAAIGIYELGRLRDFAARRMTQREHDRLEAIRDEHEATLRRAKSGHL